MIGQPKIAKLLPIVHHLYRGRARNNHPDMKRRYVTNELQLQVLAHDMTLAVRQGEVQLEPLVMATFFYSNDALLETLRTRPILIINLMSTSKAMRQLWNAIPRLWITLMDALQTRINGEAGLLYPFLVVQDAANRARYDRLFEAVDFEALPEHGADLLSYAREQRDLLTPFSYALRGMENMRPAMGWMAGDAVVPAFNDMLVYALHINNMLVAALEEWPDGGYVSYRPNDILVHDLGIFAIDGNYIRARASPADVLEKMRAVVEHLADRMRIFSHGPLLGKEVELTVTTSSTAKGVRRKFVPLVVVRALDTLARLVDSAQYRINRLIEQEGSVAAAADALTVEMTPQLLQSYRDTVWSVMYPSADEQRLFLLQEVRKFTKFNPDQIQEMNCVMCGDATSHVATQHQLPFCEDALCRELHGALTL